jgi:hypothetical protein
MLSLRSPRLNWKRRFVGVSEDGGGGTKRSFIRGGGAMGGAILRMVCESSLRSVCESPLRRVCESSRDGGGGRRSGEAPPRTDWFSRELDGIFEGLFTLGAVDMIELPKLGRDTLAPKLLETGVLERPGGCPWIVPARVRGAVDFDNVAGLPGMLVFDGVFARAGGAARCAVA